MLRRLGLLLAVLAGAGVVHAQFNPTAVGTPHKNTSPQPAAASDPAPPPPPPPDTWDKPQPAGGMTASSGDVAKVYFYRSGIDGLARRATINVDGKPVCSLASERFFLMELPVGEHTFAGPDLQQAAPLTLESGKSYFFKATVDRSTVKKALLQIHNIFRIDLVTGEIGDFDVKRLKPLESSDIHP